MLWFIEWWWHAPIFKTTKSVRKEAENPKEWEWRNSQSHSVAKVCSMLLLPSHKGNTSQYHISPVTHTYWTCNWSFCFILLQKFMYMTKKKAHAIAQEEGCKFYKLNHKPKLISMLTSIVGFKQKQPLNLTPYIHWCSSHTYIQVPD